MNEELVVSGVDHVIGTIEGEQPGPTVVAFGGMHGNEPSGVMALQNVLESLGKTSGRFKGRLIALRGNTPALEQNVRFIDEDMNRIWFPSIIDTIRRTPAAELQSSERRVMKSLLETLDAYLPGEEGGKPAIFADLHSFSAEGNMFAITARKENHINLFAKLHIPIVFGIEKTLRGTAFRYYQDRGCITFALEGGQHENKNTIRNNTAAILAMLDEVGCLDKAEAGAFDQYESHLVHENRLLPSQVELAYQHMIHAGDEFRMKPGYRNFQKVEKGEWLASDKDGKIMAECDGYVLMPLYQEQGDDGFFIVYE